MRQEYKIRPASKKSRSHLSVALVFPNSRKIGLSNLGFQNIWSKLRHSSIFSTDRFFVNETLLKNPNTRSIPVSEENQIPLKNFQIIAFSIPFENDYWIVPRMLISAGIPPLRRDRKAPGPLILAGGVSVSMNPEALADFLDLVFIGEIVGDIDEPSGLWGTIGNFYGSKTGIPDRKEFYRHFTNVPGVYVPEAYKFAYRDDGIISRIESLPGFPESVKAVKRSSTDEPTPMAIIDNTQTEFSNSCLLEINRGCSRGCKFCSGGWIHRPVRYYDYNNYRGNLEEPIKTKKTIGLIGSDLASHPELLDILNDIVD